MTKENKSVIVTGGSQGIGLAIAKAFAANGAKVAIVARNGKTLAEAVSSIKESGGDAIGVSADVTNFADVERSYAEIKKVNGPADVLVNNAGVHYGFGPFWEIKEEEWLADINISLTGTFYYSKVAAPDMIANNSGRIINLVGGGFNSGTTNMTGYAVAKTAIMRLTENMGLELAEHNVSVFAVQPGLVDTPGNQAKIKRDVVKKWTKLEDWLAKFSIPAEKAADLSVKLASGDFDALTGRVFYASEDSDEVVAKSAEILEKNTRRMIVT